MKISILAIGSELLDGRVLNSNAQYISRKLAEYNIEVQEILTVDDDIDLICDAITYLSQKTNYIITSGGLGPTSDDLTRQAVATYFNYQLVEDPELLLDIKNWYQSKKRDFIEINRVQALIPENSIKIRNFNGTAPGFITKNKILSIACLPGIPRELYLMFNDIIQDLTTNHPTYQTYQTVFKLFGIPESLIATNLKQVQFPLDTKIIYQVQFPEIKVILVNNNNDHNLEAKEKFLANIESKFIFALEDIGLEKVIHKLLIEKNKTLSMAESCSGGFLSNLITNTAGSSKYYLGGITCYDNKIKEFLGVNPKTLKDHGAVSEQVAIELVNQITNKFNSDCGIAITGVAGPDGGTENKPVGTVWIAVKVEDKIICDKYFWNYSREQIKQFAAYQALDILRKLLTS